MAKDKNNNTWIWIIALIIGILIFISWRENNKTNYINNTCIPAAKEIGRSDPENEWRYIANCYSN